MILLDTNVLSELMRPQPNPVVVDWICLAVDLGKCEPGSLA
jgi:predicted nucleic acid-binding protein